MISTLIGTLPELLPGANNNDFNLYFAGSWINVLNQQTKKWNWQYIIKIDDDFITFFRQNDPVSIKECVVNLNFPESGYYNFRATSVFLYRNMQRHSTKGINLESVEIDNFFSEIVFNMLSEVYPEDIRAMVQLKLSSWNIPGDSLKKTKKYRGLYEILNNPNTLSIQQSVKIIQRHQNVLARTLNRNFCVSKGISSKYPSLWYKQFLVGEFVSEKRINIFPTDFDIEVCDFASNNQLDW